MAASQPRPLFGGGGGVTAGLGDRGRKTSLGLK